MADYDEIIRAGEILCKLKQLEENASEREVKTAATQLNIALDDLTPQEAMLALVASSILGGRPIPFSTDNEETVRRMYELAEKLGVSIDFEEAFDGRFIMVLRRGSH
jgi:hypothetical protein